VNASSIVGGINRARSSGFGAVRIRIRKLPHDKKNVEGFDLRAYEANHTYDVNAKLAELLIVMNYADPEMRREPDRAHDRTRRRLRDRRARR
jgi:hypothetical protein